MAAQPQIQPSDVDAPLRSLLAETLGLPSARVAAFDAQTELFGALPEFDSMAVAVVITELEDRLNIIVDDDDIDSETFATFGNLLAFCRMKQTA